MPNIFLIFFFAMLGIECLLLIPFSLKLSYLRKEEKVIFIYLISAIIYGGGSYLIGFVLGANNMAFVSILALIQFYILSFFYYLILKGSRVNIIIATLTILGSAIFAVDITVLGGLKRYNSIFASYQTLVLISYGIAFFLQLLRDEDLIERSIYMNSLPKFWFNAGLFVYLCCSFLISLSYNFLQNSIHTEAFMAAQKITRSLNFIAGITQLILFYIGLLKIKRARL